MTAPLTRTDGRWAVACAAIYDGRPYIAALNVYPDLAAALAAQREVAGTIGEHETALLIPVGPVTYTEMTAARDREDPGGDHRD